MKQPQPAAERVPLSEAEISRRLWRIYTMAIAAGERYKREQQAAEQSAADQSDSSAREH